jgi:hypothetical protein
VAWFSAYNEAPLQAVVALFAERTFLVLPAPHPVDKLEIESLYKQFQVLADLPVNGGAISRAAFQYCLGPFGMVDTALSDSIFKVRALTDTTVVLQNPPPSPGRALLRFISSCEA